jgi:hypothetical protein
MAATIAAAIVNDWLAANGRWLANRFAALLAATIVAIEQATTVAAAKQLGFGLRLEGDLGGQCDGHAQHQTNDITLHQKILQTTTRNIGLRRLPAVLALHTQFTGPTIETPGGGFRKSPKHFGTRKLVRLNSMGSPDYLGW